MYFKKWEKGTDDSQKYKCFYDIRERAKTTFGDYLLLTEVLTDEQLQNIFTKYNTTKKEQQFLHKRKIEFQDRIHHIPAFHNMLESLFRLEYKNEPVIDHDGKLADTISMSKDEDDAWKARFTEETINICLKFFKEHRLISTKVHERLVEEVEDMINVEVARGTKLKLSERVKNWI